MSKPLFLLAGLVAAAAYPSMNVLRVAAAAKDGETITIGSDVFEIDTDDVVTTGRHQVDLTGSETIAAAAKLLTFASNVEADDTVTIAGVVYTFKDSLTASTTAGEVLIGADLTASRNNLLAAVNRATGSGTLYGSLTTAQTTVVGTATSTDGLTITAVTPGTAGNSIAIAEASTHLSWAGGATALSGGVDPTAAEVIAAVVIAINLQTTGFRAVAQGTEEVLLVSTDGKARAATATTETMAGSGNAWYAATTFGGAVEPVAAPITQMLQRAAVAGEVSTGFMRFPCGFAPTRAVALVHTSAGAPVAWDGVVSISGNIVSVSNAGSTDWAATNVVTVIASNF